jgi:hypothetical protein
VILSDHLAIPNLIGYEALLARSDPAALRRPRRERRLRCASPRRPPQSQGRGVLHRALLLHSLMLGHVDGLALSEKDVLLPISRCFPSIRGACGAARASCFPASAPRRRQLR